MNWIDLHDLSQLENLKEQSHTKTQIIYKHSATCSISKMVYARLNNAQETFNADFYYLDLLAHRDVSNAVAETFGVQHESPQALIIQNGVCIFNESHTAIRLQDIAEHV